MADCEKLLKKARRSPAGLRFAELCRLAECFGFEFSRQRGSHVIYKRPGHRTLMNFQDVKGKAKPVQVRNLLDALRDLGLLEEEPEDADGP